MIIIFMKILLHNFHVFIYMYSHIRRSKTKHDRVLHDMHAFLNLCILPFHQVGSNFVPIEFHFFYLSGLDNNCGNKN